MSAPDRRARLDRDAKVLSIRRKRRESPTFSSRAGPAKLAVFSAMRGSGKWLKPRLMPGLRAGMKPATIGGSN